MNEWLYIIGLLILLVVIMVGFRFLMMKMYKSGLNKEETKVKNYSDKVLLKRYKNLDKTRKNKFLAWYTMGFFFYKEYLQYLESLYQIYRQEVLSRGLMGQ
ncbi:hypothetical protein IV487_11040 [Enterococcus saccharolyticus]|uniref:Uncharacterized protein n=1 Tax=Candidatus Enterococcus willemsii TaxID=1857215 RepID=A0ABQ6YXQ5_9ENTE|nr:MULTISPECIES: hypothetical protein [Enterococcus]KAF1302538.1 hypothetical protein BAU17_02280 [Enterococcus sp. CU12B]MCD5002998.1 hypothetical protein [Enterococcus saccharolyticus]